jgi:DNA-binding CsgD family transcriptional regulator
MKMADRLVKGLSHCIDLLYESAIDSASWTPALRAINKLIGGNGAVYLVFNGNDSIKQADIADIPLEALQLYNLLYEQDPRREELRRLPCFEVFNDAGLRDRRAFEQTDVFNLVLEPYDIPNHVMTAIPQTDGAYGAIVVQRSRCRGPAGRQEEDLMRMLGPHVARAHRMQRLLGEQRSRASLAEDVLERLPHPIAVLGSDRKVLRMSLALREILTPHRGLCYWQGKLRAKKAQDDANFERACALAMAHGSLACTGSTLTIAEPPPSSGLVLSVYPIPPDSGSAGDAKCLVIVRDPQRIADSLVLRLMQAYELTRAEARLAEVLIGGVSLQAAADRLEVTVNTCKTQLQAVYRKTDSRNRMELARVILALT